MLLNWVGNVYKYVRVYTCIFAYITCILSGLLLQLTVKSTASEFLYMKKFNLKF